MTNASTLSSCLDAALRRSPPALLFHYTSSEGLVGILKSKEMWASNVTSLNDTKEIDHAVDCAKNAIENRIGRGGIPDAEKRVLNEMLSYAGSAAKRYYVASFSEERDLLSQWRAYCPPGGGYALGLPSVQLTAMAQHQAFILAPCIYEHTEQYQIVSEFLESHLTKFRALLSTTDDETALCKQLSWEFGQHLARFGSILKHPAFREEKEWRLISSSIQEPHPQLDFRGTLSRIVPYFRFKLLCEEFPDLARIGRTPLTAVAGPTSDHHASAMALQFLLRSTIGRVGHGASSIPYRTW